MGKMSNKCLNMKKKSCLFFYVFLLKEVLVYYGNVDYSTEELHSHINGFLLTLKVQYHLINQTIKRESTE